MLIGIHREPDKNPGIAERWAEHLADRGVDVRWINLTTPDPISQVMGCDGVMWLFRAQDKQKAHRILHCIERYLDVPVYPDLSTSWYSEEKLSVYYMLMAAGIPTPETWVFWDREEAKEWATYADYPTVFKLSPGHNSQTVIKVLDANHAGYLIDRMFSSGIHSSQVKEKIGWVIPRNLREVKSLARRCKGAMRLVGLGEPAGVPRNSNTTMERGYVYFQEFIPCGFETNVLVVGDLAWAHRLFWPPNDIYLPEGGQRLDFEPNQIDPRCLDMAFNVSKRLGLQSACIDFLMDDRGPLVSDIGCSTVRSLGPRGAGDFPGCWNRNLEWLDGQRDLREAEVEAFLEKLSVA